MENQNVLREKKEKQAQGYLDQICDFEEKLENLQQLLNMKNLSENQSTSYQFDQELIKQTKKNKKLI